MKTIKDLDAVEFQYLRRTQSIKQIAAAYNTNPNAIYYWCRINNVFVSRITDWEIQEGLEQKNVKELAAEYNVSIKTIYRRAEILGINIKADLHDKIIQIMHRPGTLKENAYNAGLRAETVYNFRHRNGMTKKTGGRKCTK